MARPPREGHNIYPDERSDDVYPTEGSEGVGAEHVYPTECNEGVAAPPVALKECNALRRGPKKYPNEPQPSRRQTQKPRPAAAKLSSLTQILPLEIVILRLAVCDYRIRMRLFHRGLSS